MAIDAIASASSMQAYLKSQALGGASGSQFGEILSSEIADMGTDAESSLEIQNDALSSMLTGFSGMTGILMNMLIKAGMSDDESTSGLISYSNSAGKASFDSSAIPEQAWKPANPHITSRAGNRSRAQYSKVVNQFRVENNARYKPGENTYCNIFVWDVTRAMNAEIPHYIDAETNEPMQYGEKGTSQTSANGIYRWLRQSGETYGWYEVSASQAQHYANQGKPVVTAKYSREGSGHVQMVVPSQDGRYDESRGVTVAQAGRNLSSYTPITKIYGSDLSGVRYFAHV